MYKQGDADKFFANKEKLIDFFWYLYCRWQDEKMYEDFEEYKKALVKNLPKELSLISFTQSPFTATCSFKGRKIMLSANKKSVSWKLA